MGGIRTAPKRFTPAIPVVLFSLLSFVPVIASAQTVESFLSRAAALEKSQKYSEAESVYQQALKQFPNQPEILKRLGIVYQTELKFDQSIHAFQQALHASPDYPEVNLYLGLSYYGLNDYDKALDAFNAELKAHPDDRRAHYYAAMVLESLGRNLEAIENLEAIVKSHPDDSKAWYQLAKIYRTQAMDAFQRVADLAPNSVLVRSLKAESYAQDQQYPKAIEEYKAISKEQPDFPGLHFDLGQAYFNNVQFPEAEQELRLALEEDPNNPMANYELGDIFLRNQKAAEALPLLKIAVAGNQGFLPARVDLGKCYLALGNMEQAREDLVKAAELDPNAKEPHYVLAQVYARLHDAENQKREMAIFQALDSKRQHTLQKTARELMKQPN